MLLEDSLETYVRNLLKDYVFEKLESPKIIRDGLGGLFRFHPWEINLIDTPILQRLRNIHQTALAYLVYPSANHTRFEHSLGTATIASKMAESLLKRDETKHCIDDTTLLELRFAGLLHDIGHGPFSHVTEEIIAQLPEIQKEYERYPGKFSLEKPHEMISYLLVRSEAFRNFFEEELLKSYGLTEVRTNSVANMIIGVMDQPDLEGYKGDILNGPFDADKFDYLMRDAHSTGIRMVVDLERFLYTLLVDIRRGKPQRLSQELGGAHILEQLLFCKMLLYPSIYHHHKVRASMCMLKSIFERMYDMKLKINGCRFRKVTDFLRYDDLSFVNGALKSKTLREQIKKILDRKLLMRALVIGRHTIDESTLDNLRKLIRLRTKARENIELIREIRKEIASRVESKYNEKCEYYDIWLDLPEMPRFNEPFNYLVRITHEKYEYLSELFPAAQWASAFGEFKWQGHVFCPLALQTEVANVTSEVFKDYFDIVLLPSATIMAKHHRGPFRKIN